MVSSRYKLTSKKKQQFLELLAEYGNVSRAAQEAKIIRTHIYQIRDSDPDFAAAFDAAVKLGTAALEDEARRRAFEGCDKPVFYQGIQCGAVREYSDTLMIFLLKAHDPEKYAERTKNDVTLGGALKMDVTLSPREAAQALIRAAERDAKEPEESAE